MENPRNKMDLRQEKKYLIALCQVSGFEKKIIKLGYKLNHLPNVINNIYFDTTSMKSALENIEGAEKRTKYRIRWYNNDDNFVLEKKIKLSSSGYKEKVSLVSKDYRSAIAEVTELVGLHPVIKNCYYRKYYIKGDVRITIDTELRCSLPISHTYKHYFNAIIEIKYSTSKIYNLLDKLDLKTQLTKFSKYVTGLEMFGRI